MNAEILSESRVQCSVCGTEQESSESGCVICGDTTGLSPAVPAAFSRVRPVTSPIDAHAPRSLGSNIEQLLITIRESPVLDAESSTAKHWWKAAPVGVILVAVLLGGLVLNRTASEDAKVHQRINHEVYALAGMVNRHQKDTGLYPDAAVWQHWTSGSDASAFVDPWGRPYTYRLTSRMFAIGTLGADGQPGGRGMDGDIELSIRYARIRPSALRSSPQPAVQDLKP